MKLEKYSEWIYDDVFYRHQLATGNLNIDPDKLYSSYCSWVNVCSVGTFKNQVTGQECRKLLPKRGNRTYAKIHRERLEDLESGFDHLQFDYPMEGTRNDRLSNGFFITLTYDHKRYTIQEAWERSSRDIHQFKVQLTRILRSGKLIASISVKEAQGDSGYPAPHLFIVVDRPVRCIRWVSKKHKVSWRLNEFVEYHCKRMSVKDALAVAWGHGFLDVVAAIKGQIEGKNVLTYMFKYITKAVELQKGNTLPIMTNAWQKLFHYRAGQISSCWKALKNRRLDLTLHESQQQGSDWQFFLIEIMTMQEYFQLMLSANWYAEWFIEKKVNEIPS